MGLCSGMDARHPLLLQLGNRHRQEHGKRGALAFALTGSPNRAAVLFNELLTDRQSQPEAAICPCGRTVLLRESLKDMRKICGRNADAGVSDTQLKMRVDPLKQNLYLAALGCELDGIGQQIPHDLLQPSTVRVDDVVARPEDGLQTKALGVRRRPHRIDSRLDYLRE